MPKRKIIKIDEKKCNGCGLCIPNCPEGAIQIINKKARLVSDLFCDGLGACLGKCPQAAISIEEREATKYDERKVMENIIKQGKDVITAHLKHLAEHNQEEYLKEAVNFLKERGIEMKPENTEYSHRSGCPGMKMADLRKKTHTQNLSSANYAESQLNQWPIQLHLLNPNAPYFKDSDLLFAADCVPFSYANFHEKFLKGKILIIFCPKLDNSSQIYLDKITQIIKNNNIKSITLAHMEVPCCFGIVSIVEQALKESGKNIIIKDYTISLQGHII
ncbi:MAG: 4Fe-4S dicluster domain-containing protein [Candidatus Omnitrophota bacterium]